MNRETSITKKSIKPTHPGIIFYEDVKSPYSSTNPQYLIMQFGIITILVNMEEVKKGNTDN